ncbi:MAG: helix-turn-helix transcriptional regulator [Methanobrevibacter sp.]|nr:helix-turn-helix transcriptional regulator [Methanobrevibacter sp.]
MTFNLRKIRKEKGLTLQELADKSNVKVETIRALELKINDPSNAKMSTLVKLAKALKCKVRDFYPCEKCI